MESSVYKGANVQGYKIKKKFSGKIEGATSETQNTPTQIWLKNLLEKEKNYLQKWMYKQINK